MVFPERALDSPDAGELSLLVRGEDRHAHWDADPAPAVGDDPAIEAFMRNSFRRYRDQEAAAAT